MRFSKILENKMKEQGITKAELARRVDVADTTIGRYVKGTMLPSPLILNRIAKVLECPIKDFLK